jgi:hypothetical protein
MPRATASTYFCLPHLGLVPIRPGSVGQQWGEPLHPSVQGDVIDLDIRLAEKSVEVPVDSP